MASGWAWFVDLRFSASAATVAAGAGHAKGKIGFADSKRCGFVDWAWSDDEVFGKFAKSPEREAPIVGNPRTR